MKEHIHIIMNTANHSGWGWLPSIRFGDKYPYGSSVYGKIVIEIVWMRLHFYITREIKQENRNKTNIG